jgi:hypothetical protein
LATWWIERIVCARAPRLTSVHDPGWPRAGDKMLDGVIPLWEALRPLDLSRPSTPGRVGSSSSGAGRGASDVE